jgi:hypothetical protein
MKFCGNDGMVAVAADGTPLRNRLDETREHPGLERRRLNRHDDAEGRPPRSHHGPLTAQTHVYRTSWIDLRGKKRGLDRHAAP